MIIVQLAGGLGNQMFQYAYGKALSVKLNCELNIDDSLLTNRVPCTVNFRNYQLDYFNLDSQFAKNIGFPQYPSNFSITNPFIRGLHYFKVRINGFQYIRQKGFNYRPWHPSVLAKIFLDGYWQSEKFFKEQEDFIRADFSFRNQLFDIARTTELNIIKSNSVCVHIRRGDYLKNQDVFHLVDIDYIRNAVDEISKDVESPVFYVFSDDIKWCKENIKIQHETVFITSTNAGESSLDHFQLMSKCKHFIISNSSFSWWAAWLSLNKEKIVIAPKKWFASDKLNDDDLIPSTWTRF